MDESRKINCVVDVVQDEESLLIDYKKLKAFIVDIAGILLLDSIEVSILLTNDERIKKINYKYRNINEKTDTVSFPQFEKNDLNQLLKQKANGLEVTPPIILGDIVISLETIRKSAGPDLQKLNAEFKFILIHSFLHLLGYDHAGTKESLEMKRMENKLIAELKHYDQIVKSYS